MTKGGDRQSDEFSKHQNDALNSAGKTAAHIAKELGVGQKTVERAGDFSAALDEAETISPGIREAVLSGEVKTPKNLVAEIRNVPEEHRPQVVEAIKRGDATCWNSFILKVFHCGASAELGKKQNDHFDHIVF